MGLGRRVQTIPVETAERRPCVCSESGEPEIETVWVHPWYSQTMGCR